MEIDRKDDAKSASLSEKVYRKPTLKRHGLVSELTMGSTNFNPPGSDSYGSPGYGYS